MLFRIFLIPFGRLLLLFKVFSKNCILYLILVISLLLLSSLLLNLFFLLYNSSLCLFKVFSCSIKPFNTSFSFSILFLYVLISSSIFKVFSLKANNLLVLSLLFSSLYFCLSLKSLISPSIFSILLVISIKVFWLLFISISISLTLSFLFNSSTS